MDCPICCEPFSATIAARRPRLLPSCAHTICSADIDHLVLSQQQGAGAGAGAGVCNIRCPICRAVSFAAAAEGLKLNYSLMDSIAEIERITSERDEAAAKESMAKDEVKKVTDRLTVTDAKLKKLSLIKSEWSPPAVGAGFVSTSGAGNLSSMTTGESKGIQEDVKAIWRAHTIVAIHPSSSHLPRGMTMNLSVPVGMHHDFRLMEGFFKFYSEDYKVAAGDEIFGIVIHPGCNLATADLRDLERLAVRCFRVRTGSSSSGSDGRAIPFMVLTEDNPGYSRCPDCLELRYYAHLCRCK
jgi:hypothetical protein